MVEHHLNKKDSISRANEVILRTPILRQNWEHAHEDVELTKKLGEKQLDIKTRVYVTQNATTFLILQSL
ncbi:unnamed protein product [Nippostrongylus brasiliensis]|uniref:Transposase n=1 Tax=Nippostrongylus brasiliensis TaxID=27835 RepID=A0A0N4XH65_NIPBR|nr:unnamed protein product [Nippostrongylus brasiliensis]